MTYALEKMIMKIVSLESWTCLREQIRKNLHFPRDAKKLFFHCFDIMGMMTQKRILSKFCYDWYFRNWKKCEINKKRFHGGHVRNSQNVRFSS